LNWKEQHPFGVSTQISVMGVFVNLQQLWDPTNLVGILRVSEILRLYFALGIESLSLSHINKT
jgi:hypothetical protein